MKQIEVTYETLEYYFRESIGDGELTFEDILDQLNRLIRLNINKFNEESMKSVDFTFEIDGFKTPRFCHHNFLEFFKTLWANHQEQVVDYICRYIEFGIHKNHSYHSNEYSIPSQRRSMYSNGPIDYVKR